MSDNLQQNSSHILLNLFDQHYKSAVESYEQSDYKYARQAFEQCIQIIEASGVSAEEQIPEKYYSFMMDSRSLMYSGYGDTLNYGFADLAGAAEAYRKALRYQPGEKMLTFQYVEALYEQSRFREGLAAMEDLRRRTPHDLDVLIILANLYWCENEGAVALKHAFECIRRCEQSDYRLNIWIRDPEYYLSARSLVEEILIAGEDTGGSFVVN